MNLIKSICGLMETSKVKSVNEGKNSSETTSSENSELKSPELLEPSPPRDGMSEESAKFLIGKCAHNRAYKVYGLENKGRYFTAKVIDPKGNVVNEILVDKLTGRVKFIR